MFFAKKVIVVMGNALIHLPLTLIIVSIIQ